MGLKKEVVQIKDGDVVAVFASAKDASNHTGITINRIRKCCYGKTKTIDGCVFQYKNSSVTQPIRNEDQYKCPFCTLTFKTYLGLCKHIFQHKAHKNKAISKEELLTIVKYNGIRPTCKCGCGQWTNISYDNGIHFREYVRGHANRIHNNWGHNPTAMNKSAQTRRTQFALGQRQIWNKSKKWEETYSKQKIEELKATYQNAERNQKISQALKGRPFSPEHAAKCAAIMRSPRMRMILSSKMQERLKNGVFTISSQIEKKFISECIAPLNIPYQTQYYIKDLHHYCDVYLPLKNTIVEFQGDYWHANPHKYSMDTLTSYQLKQTIKDQKLRDYCHINNINLIEIWESDYKNNVESINKLLKDNLL